MGGPAALTRHARPLSWGRLFVVQLSVRVGRYATPILMTWDKEPFGGVGAAGGRSCKDKGVETEWGNASSNRIVAYGGLAVESNSFEPFAFPSPLCWAKS